MTSEAGKWIHEVREESEKDRLSEVIAKKPRNEREKKEQEDAINALSRFPHFPDPGKWIDSGGEGGDFGL